MPWIGINNVMAGVSIAGSVAGAAKAISDLKSNKKSPSRATAPSMRGSAAAPQAPAFNVVGASPENQLAQALGQKESQPIKAFVVSNDITNAQALDRNIVESASLG